MVRHGGVLGHHARVLLGGEGTTANGVNIFNSSANALEVDLTNNYISGQGNPRQGMSVSRGVNFDGDGQFKFVSYTNDLD